MQSASAAGQCVVSSSFYYAAFPRMPHWALHASVRLSYVSLVLSIYLKSDSRINFKQIWWRLEKLVSKFDTRFEVKVSEIENVKKNVFRA